MGIGKNLRMKNETYKKLSNQKLKKLQDKNKSLPLLQIKVLETLKLIKYSKGFFDIDLFEKIVRQTREKPVPFKNSLEIEETLTNLIPSARAISNINFHEKTTNNFQNCTSPVKPKIYKRPYNRRSRQKIKNKKSNIFKKKYSKIKLNNQIVRMHLIPKTKNVNTTSQESFQSKTSISDGIANEIQNTNWWDTVKNILYYLNSVLFE